MPTVATQTAIADRRRASAAGSNQQGRSVASSSATNGKYGALQLKKSTPEEEDDEDEEEEDSSPDSSSTSEDSSVTRFSDLTGKQWAAVGMLAIANLCSTVAFSCIAPFYPGEAQMKGLTTSEIGVIFGVFELVMFVTTPILGKYVSL